MRQGFLWGVLTAVSTVVAFGNTVVFGLNHEFSGGTPPAGTSLPWITATFTDVAGGVNVSMANSGLVGSEFVSAWYFNLNPIYNPANLSISFVTGSGQPATSILQSVSQATNTPQLKADGDGYFDFKFSFSTSGASKFTAGETSSYLISGISGLSALDFIFDSAPGGGNGTWKSAAHIQGIGASGTGGGWIGASQGIEQQDNVAPEPSSYLFFGSITSILCLGILAKRRKARNGSLGS